MPEYQIKKSYCQFPLNSNSLVFLFKIIMIFGETQFSTTVQINLLYLQPRNSLNVLINVPHCFLTWSLSPLIGTKNLFVFSYKEHAHKTSWGVLCRVNNKYLKKSTQRLCKKIANLSALLYSKSQQTK